MFNQSKYTIKLIKYSTLDSIVAKSKQRLVADVNRKKITESASTLFTRKGFAAMSIQEITLYAGIYLIHTFHHFKNKKILSNAMEQSFIEEIQVSDCKKVGNLKDFISWVINVRF